MSDIFRAAAAAPQRHVGRAVWQVTLRDDAAETATAYAKLTWGRRRWWPRMTDIRTGRVFQSYAVREWRGLENLSRLGLHVPERLALFEEGLLWRRSAIIVRAVPPPLSLSEMICGGAWPRLPLPDRRAIFVAVAETLARIHAGGLAWRSISSRHLYPQRTAEGRWELWLIDCEGVHRARSKSVKDRDWQKLERALLHDRADSNTLDLFRDVRWTTHGVTNGGQSGNRSPGLSVDGRGDDARSRRTPAA